MGGIHEGYNPEDSTEELSTNENRIEQRAKNVEGRMTRRITSLEENGAEFDADDTELVDQVISVIDDIKHGVDQLRIIIDRYDNPRESEEVSQEEHGKAVQELGDLLVVRDKLEDIARDYIRAIRKSGERGVRRAERNEGNTRRLERIEELKRQASETSDETERTRIDLERARLEKNKNRLDRQRKRRSDKERELDHAQSHIEEALEAERALEAALKGRDPNESLEERELELGQTAAVEALADGELEENETSFADSLDTMVGNLMFRNGSGTLADQLQSPNQFKRAYAANIMAPFLKFMMGMGSDTPEWAQELSEDQNTPEAKILEKGIGLVLTKEDGLVTVSIDPDKVDKDFKMPLKAIKTLKGISREHHNELFDLLSRRTEGDEAKPMRKKELRAWLDSEEGRSSELRREMQVIYDGLDAEVGEDSVVLKALNKGQYSDPEGFESDEDIYDQEEEEDEEVHPFTEKMAALHSEYNFVRGYEYSDLKDKSNDELDSEIGKLEGMLGSLVSDNEQLQDFHSRMEPALKLYKETVESLDFTDIQNLNSYLLSVDSRSVLIALSDDGDVNVHEDPEFAAYIKVYQQVVTRLMGCIDLRNFPEDLKEGFINTSESRRQIREEGRVVLGQDEIENWMEHEEQLRLSYLDDGDFPGAEVGAAFLEKFEDLGEITQQAKERLESEGILMDVEDEALSELTEAQLEENIQKCEALREQLGAESPMLARANELLTPVMTVLAEKIDAYDFSDISTPEDLTGVVFSILDETDAAVGNDLPDLFSFTDESEESDEHDHDHSDDHESPDGIDDVMSFIDKIMEDPVEGERFMTFVLTFVSEFTSHFIIGMKKDEVDFDAIINSNPPRPAIS